MLTIARLENTKLIRHPMFWGILALTFTFSALLFYRLCVDFLTLSHQALQHKEIQASLSLEVIKPLCSWNMVILAIICPIFTTYAISHEYKQRTFYLIANSANTTFSILMGKYLNLMLINIGMALYTVLMISILQLETNLQWPMIGTALLAQILVGSCFISFGLLISSLMPQPLLAIGLSFFGNMIWMLLEWINPFPFDWALAQHLSILSHCHHLLNGAIFSPDLVYYALFNGLFLTLAYRVLKNKLEHVSL
jgi:ABC-2 type transport system permease protein